MYHIENNLTEYNPLKYILLTILGIIFPPLKYIIIAYLIKSYSHCIIVYNCNFSLPLSILFNNICQYYFWWQLISFVGFNYYRANFKSEWFSFFSIFYNYLIYQTIILSQFKTNPLLGVFFTSFLQHLDSTPIVIALLDNIVSLYYFPFEFLPEKLFLYFICSLVSYCKN
jgi:hypothetical protein